MTVWFPGQKTPIPNRSWRETEAGEKFVGVRGLHLECSIPARLCEGINPKNSRVDVPWVLFANIVERLGVSIRWRTGQFWIGRPPYIIGLDLEAAWYDSKGTRCGRCSGSSGWLPNWGDKENVKPLGVEEWRQVEADLQTDEEPALYQTFLWDARYSMEGDDVLRGVLYAAVGVEIFTREFYARHGATIDPLYKWVVGRRDEAQPPFHEYYDSLALCLCGRSLKDDQPKIFQLIQNLFQTRNKIMHEGRAYRRSGKTELEAHQASLAEMLLAAESAITWLTQHGS
ncbi:MAG: hypothetical protein HYZ95_03710 [Candidatus Omnitrophica bacterium]|nr:hypothetical protein [Candidatus Omnitrophota bacterium]